MKKNAIFQKFFFQKNCVFFGDHETLEENLLGLPQKIQYGFLLLAEVTINVNGIRMLYWILG